MGKYAKKVAKATKVYNNTWKQLSSDFGAQGQPAPLVSFLRGPDSLPGMDADVYIGPDGVRQISIGRPLIKSLASKYWKRDAKHDLAHEFRHVYQNDPLFSDQRNLSHDLQPMEADAITFSDAAMHHLAHKTAIGVAKRAGNQKKLRRLRSEKLAPIDQTNVSQYYGLNPTTILWPN